MRAARITSLDGPNHVAVADVETPVRADDQVTIEVHAAGVAFPDVLLTRGLYQLKPELPFVPGAEVAGVVTEAPPGRSLREGDRVAALTLLGGFAETAVAPVGSVYRLPHDISFATGAALPMNYLTAQFALDRRGRMKTDDVVLVHGAAGGVGTAAVQFAKWRGARVIAVVSTPEKEAVAKAAGADDVVPADGFLAAVKDLTGGRGVDIVFDPVGGDRFTDSLRALAAEGRLLVIGFTAGEIPTVRVNRLLLNNIDVTGVAWGNYALAVPGFLAEQWSVLDPGLRSGALDPLLGESFPLEQAAQALRTLDERRATGKVILTVRGS